MSIAYAPTTELDAVNELLGAIGEAPVNQLDNLGLTDAATARNRLYDAMRRVQKRGWSWNTEYGLSLVPDATGNVWVPSNTLKVTFVKASKDKGLTLRGSQIHDSRNHTNIFTLPVVVDLVTMEPWANLLESAR